MSKGWQEHRYESDGRWQATGQLRDAGQWPPPDAPKVMPTVTGRDTANVIRMFYLPQRADRPVRVGTLGWAQFSRL